ncbi:alpha/beta hydrolase [Leucobacter viscericola]|uniref:Alpha/beta hydrolase n=1 Tax=Leucobacter viscericola TaxID=2714935 RepID=A0A6G7XFZ5_9MICO|nr:alpha/beta hydrolase [Leucobacter viscericola]QIK63298.1 alpha/beta hydrolase [Leucobacter viscericola]
MIEKKTTFYSEGAVLQASFYYPDDYVADGNHPVLIVNSGYQGFNEFYPKMFAELFTARGYVCFGFDYRGMADSEGPKGTVLLEQQVEDVRNAVTFVQNQPNVDPKRIALLGWGMGAANVVMAAEHGRNVAAVVAMNGFYDGERWLKSVHTYDEWTKILEEVEQDRVRRVLEGESKLADTFEHYPLDPATKDYVANELEQVYGFGHPTRLQFTESIISTNVEQAAARLDTIPLFIAHGVDNTLHPIAEAEGLFAAAASPKVFYRVDGRHNDFMFVDHPVFVAMCDQVEAFLTPAFEESAHEKALIVA